MSTVGLKRRPHYEEVLNAAHKDQASQQGILGVGLQNFATRAINSPLFQRVQMGIEEKMQGDQRRHVEEQGFQHDIQAMAVDQNVSAHDLRWVVENLQRPPPVPTQVPQQLEARIDYVRMAAEMDALAQRRAVQAAHQQVAAQATQHMTVATPQTSAQLMIRDHTTASAATPAPAPTAGAAIPVPGLLSIADAPRTRPRARAASTPYGANSSLAVPPGGFSARASTAAPAAPAPVAPTPQISASVQAIARQHMLEIAKRHMQARTVTATQRAAITKQRRRGQAAVFPEETGQSMGKRKNPAPPRGSAVLMDNAPNSNRSRTAPPGAMPGTQYFRLDRA